MSDIILSVDGDLRPLESKLNKISSRSVNLNLKDSLSQPLGRITGKVSEFEKSLEASNARVLAFGASAGAVYAIQRAFGEVVKATLEVEKSLTDINVVLNASTKDLGKFGKELFSIAKNTSQGFDQVAKAATEFARQGLGIEETLKRTNDALILSRLSGLDAAKSVEALTAAVNSFARAGLTSSQIINKLATVDAAFAVSTADLAEAISRVGSTAQDVGVNFDELIAIVTAAQQTTARGGAVIGNSFKTIFTRLQRTDTLDELEAVGIAVRDLQGNTLPAIQILKNLSDVFYQLSDSQRASVAETVGGVFQINILRAALSDLSKEYSVYSGALNASRTAADQAIQRNQALNQTLSALTNKTFVNLQEAAARIGELTIAPSLKIGLGGLNSILEEFNKPEELQGTGTKIATGILKGIGGYLSGPGLAVIGAAFIKIFGGLTKFSAEALKSLIGISSQADKIASAQARVNAILAQNPSLIQAIISKESSLLQIENQILRIIEQQNTARAVGATISARVAPAAARIATPTVKTKAGGYIPNFVSPTMQEKMGAYAGGYTPGAVKKMGGMYYNTAESVVQFAGADGPAIMPPQNSLAGENYRSAFRKQVGFDPYAYRGYVPNFAPLQANYPEKISPSSRVSMIYAKKAGIGVGTGIAKYGGYDIPIKFNTAGFSAQRVKKPADVDLETQLGNYLTRFTNNFAQRIFAGGPSGSSARIGGIGELSNKGSFKSIVGTVFETAVDLAAGKLNEGRPQNAPIDFAAPNTLLRRMFGNAPGAYEAKVNNNQDQLNSVAQKMVNTGLVSDSLKSALGISGKKEGKRRAKQKPARFRQASFGYIPNFAALQDAIAREQAAGVNPNLIRVGTSSSLMSRNNPLGLGVYNTRDEPAGLQQGVNRYSGVIPNFADGPKITNLTPQLNELKKAAEKSSDSLKKHSNKINENQSKLVALGLGISVLQGTILQFGDTNSKVIQGLNQSLTALSSVSTAIGTFGGGKKGIAAAGTMLAIQGVAGLSANADKPLTQQMDSLNKAMESSRAATSKLESVVSNLNPTLNAYAEELKKAEPDPEAIAKFRTSILDGIADLGPELRDKIMKNLSTPEGVMGAISEEQRKQSVAQSQIALGQTVTAEQGKARADMGAWGQFGRILTGTGIGPLADYGQGLMNKEMKPTFQSKESIDSAAQSVMAPILSLNPDDFLTVADALSQSSGSASEFFAVLEAGAVMAGASTESIAQLKSELAKNPEAAQKMVAATMKLTQTELKAAEARAKAAAVQPKAPGYKGISSVQGEGIFDEEFVAQPMDKLNAALSRIKMVETMGAGPGKEEELDRLAGQAVLLARQAGLEAPEEYKERGARYIANVQRQQMEQAGALGFKPAQDILAGGKNGYDFGDAGTQTMKELEEKAGEGKVKLNDLGSKAPELTEDQKKAQEKAAEIEAIRKRAEDVPKETKVDFTPDVIKPTPVPSMDASSIINTLLAGGGTAATMAAVGGGILGAKGVSAAGKGAINLGKNVVGGAVNFGKSAVGGAGRAFTAGRVGLNALVAGGAGNSAFAANVGQLAAMRGGTAAIGGVGGLGFTAGATLGYGISQVPVGDKGENVASVLGDKLYDTMPDLFTSLSQNLPGFLGGGGASALTEEEQASQAKGLEVALATLKESQQQFAQQFENTSRPEEFSKAEMLAKSEEAATEKAKATEKEKPFEISNTISVSPSINIAQEVAMDKAELQKIIEAEVKKFGEAIVKIADEKAKAREKGVVNPPQNLNLTA